ncbi:hypothetical protein KEM52_001524 [Ascosphaera acerosa]|nr:hypothetical protein KEM52_001524 [Ascosphaera acerosa]
MQPHNKCPHGTAATTEMEDPTGLSGLRLCDAHCHPTEMMASTAKIPELRTAGLIIMSTRHQDQHLVERTADVYGGRLAGDGMSNDEGRVVPSFGWHPWYSHLVMDDSADGAANSMPPVRRKVAHYEAILSPRLRYENDLEDRRLINALPAPLPWCEVRASMQARLRKHPRALVGEVGLDKSFRIPMPAQSLDEGEATHDQWQGWTSGARLGRPLSRFRVSLAHQKHIFALQLRLAAEMGRPVSIHSVGAHGAVYDVLKDVAQAVRQSPLRVCLHSFTGSREQIALYLRSALGMTVYFSFSAVVNMDGKTDEQVQRLMTTIRTVPDDRLLVETDLHEAGPELDSCLLRVVKQVCHAKEWDLESGAAILNNNWKRFVCG